MPLSYGNLVGSASGNGLPSVGQYNSNFMANNPQYGSNSNAGLSIGQIQGINRQSSQTGYQSPSSSTIAYKPIDTSQPAQTQTSAAAAPGQPSTPTTPYGQAQGGLLNLGTGSNSTVNSAVNTSQGVSNNQGVYSPQISQATSGLLNKQSASSPAVTQAQNQYNELAKNSPILQAEVAGNPNVAAEVASGRGQVLGNQLSGQLQGAAQNVQNALGAQGQQITAGNEAGNMAQNAQGQILGAANQAGNLGLNQQSQQISALGGVSGPISGPGGYLYNPQSNPGSPSSQASAVGNAQTIGQMAANNPAYSAAYTALNGADGQSGVNQQMQSILSSNPQLNSMPFSIENGVLNLGNQYLSGNPAAVSFLSSANQALQHYSTILGNDPVQGALKNIQSQGIGQVLQTLNDLSKAKIMGQNAGLNGTNSSNAISQATPLQSNNSSNDPLNLGI